MWCAIELRMLVDEVHMLEAALGDAEPDEPPAGADAVGQLDVLAQARYRTMLGIGEDGALY